MDFAAVLVLELDQAAARAAVAKALPFFAGHRLQGLDAPESARVLRSHEVLGSLGHARLPVLRLRGGRAAKSQSQNEFAGAARNLNRPGGSSAASHFDPARRRSGLGHGPDRGARQVVQIALDCVKDRSRTGRGVGRGVALSSERGMSRFRKAVARGLLAFDAFVDSSLYDAQRRSIRALQAVAAFSDRFHLSGARKFARRGALRRPESRRGGIDRRPDVGAAGFSRDERRGLAQARGSRGDVPRPLRRGGRPARHQARRRDPVRATARSFHQGRARHRGSPLLRPFRHRRDRHAARLDRQRPRRRRRAGRLLDHPAARQEPVSDQRALDFAQDQGSLSRAVARAPSDEEGNPRPLSRSRLYGRRRVRRAGGGAILFRQVGARHQPRGGRHARRPFQGADEIFAERQSARRARPRQRCPEQSRRRRLHDRGAGLCGAAQSGDPRQLRTAAPAPIGIWTSPTTK